MPGIADRQQFSSQGKVSTPRNKPEGAMKKVVRSKEDDIKCCFGFDDSSCSDDDNSCGTSSGGGTAVANNTANSCCNLTLAEVTMPEPEMDVGFNFGKLRLDDADDEVFRFPSNQEEQADTGLLLFDGQGLFDEQPPEVTTVQPAEVPAASSQEVPPPVAEPEQHEAANELDDPPAKSLTEFPNVINGVREEDNGKAIFSAMANFDTKTLLKLRTVSPEWRDGIDAHTTLWSRMPLRKAVEDNRVDIVRQIVDYGDDPNPGNYGGDTPLHEAARRGHVDIVRLILAKAKDPNPATTGGITPLFWAAYRGVTPLHEATERGHVDVVRLILARAQDPNPADNTGWTPLHSAAEEGHIEVVRLLLARVHDPNPADQDGNTPLGLAERGRHSDVIQAINDRIAGNQ